MTTVERIFELINENKLTAKEFANNIGISQGNITDWKKGRSKPSVNALEKIAIFFDVSVDYLMCKSNIRNSKDTIYIDTQKIVEGLMAVTGSTFHIDKEKKLESLITFSNSNSIISIPIVGKITAGQPILAEEYLEGYLPVDPNIYGMSTAEELFYLRVSGQSMNLKVKNGDYALIKKQDYAEDGDIIVAIVNGDDEATLKKYKKLNEQFVLLEPMSSDPTIEAITVDLKNTEFKIIGKAIGQFGKF